MEKVIKKNILFLLVLLFMFEVMFVPARVFAQTGDVSIASTAAILVEKSTGRILYEKRSTEQFYPASVTKIMTAILVIENSSLDDIVTVSGSSVENIPSGYVTIDLRDGEEITIRDLLYALMLPSANDAAFVLADHIGGSVENFSAMMNEKAAELGCKNTNFVNPNGIHNESHYSTAYDLYLIANYAMKNPIFKEIVKTKEYTLAPTNIHPETDRVIKNTNELLFEDNSNYYPYADGIKTGTTTQAGKCLVSQSSRDGLDFIAVVLGGQGVNSNRFQDATKLFNYGYDNYTLTKIIDKDSVIDTVEVKKATKETKMLDVAIDDSITVMNHKSLDINQIIPEVKIDEELIAPIAKGQKIGSIKYKVDDIEYSANLIAASDVLKRNYYEIYITVGLALLLASFIISRRTHKSKRSRRR